MENKNPENTSPVLNSSPDTNPKATDFFTEYNKIKNQSKKSFGSELDNISGTRMKDTSGTDLGNSSYDQTLNTDDVFRSDFDLQERINENRAQSQEWYGDIGRGIGRALNRAGTEILKGAVSLGSIPFALAAPENEKLQTLFNNSIHQNIEKFRQAGNDNLFPVYLKESYRNGTTFDNLLSTSFYANEGADGLGFLLSMMGVSGALNRLKVFQRLAPATGNIASKLKFAEKVNNIQSNIYKTTKLTPKLLDDATTILTVSGMEAGAEAANYYDTIMNDPLTKEDINKLYINTGKFAEDYNRRTSELFTLFENGELSRNEYNNLLSNLESTLLEENLKMQVANGMRDVTMSNMALLILPNTIMHNALFKNTSKAAKAGSKSWFSRKPSFDIKSPKVRNNKLQYGKKILTTGLSEGLLEEGMQVNVSERATDKIRNKGYNKDESYFDDINISSFITDYLHNIKTDEGIKSAYLGFLLGGGMTAITTPSQIRKEITTRNTIIESLKNRGTGISKVLENDIYEIDPETGHFVYEVDSDGNVKLDEKGLPVRKIDQNKLHETLKEVKKFSDINDVLEQAYLNNDQTEINRINKQLTFDYLLPYAMQGELGLEMAKEYLETSLDTQSRENAINEFNTYIKDQNKSKEYVLEDVKQTIKSTLEDVKFIKKELEFFEELGLTNIPLQELKPETKAKFLNDLKLLYVNNKFELKYLKEEIENLKSEPLVDELIKKYVDSLEPNNFDFIPSVQDIKHRLFNEKDTDFRLEFSKFSKEALSLSFDIDNNYQLKEEREKLISDLFDSEKLRLSDTYKQYVEENEKEIAQIQNKAEIAKKEHEAINKANTLEELQNIKTTSKETTNAKKKKIKELTNQRLKEEKEKAQTTVQNNTTQKEILKSFEESMLKSYVFGDKLQNINELVDTTHPIYDHEVIVSIVDKVNDIIEFTSLKDSSITFKYDLNTQENNTLKTEEDSEMFDGSLNDVESSQLSEPLEKNKSDVIENEVRLISKNQNTGKRVDDKLSPENRYLNDDWFLFENEPVNKVGQKVFFSLRPKNDKNKPLNVPSDNNDFEKYFKTFDNSKSQNEKFYLAERIFSTALKKENPLEYIKSLKKINDKIDWLEFLNDYLPLIAKPEKAKAGTFIDTRSDNENHFKIFAKTTKPLRESIILNTLENKSLNVINSQISSQFPGTLQLDNNNGLVPENNVLGFHFMKVNDYINEDGVLNDKGVDYIHKNLFFVSGNGNIKNTLGEESLKLNRNQNELQKGQVYLKIPMTNGKDFYLKLNIGTLKNRTQSETILDLYQWRMFSDPNKIIEKNVLFKTLPEELKTNLKSAFENEFKLFEKLNISEEDITLKDFIDLIVYDGNIDSKAAFGFTGIKGHKDVTVLKFGDQFFADQSDFQSPSKREDFANFMIYNGSNGSSVKRRNIILYKKDSDRKINTSKKEYLQYLFNDKVLNTNAVLGDENNPTFGGYTNIFISPTIEVNNKQIETKKVVKKEVLNNLPSLTIFEKYNIVDLSEKLKEDSSNMAHTTFMTGMVNRYLKTIRLFEKEQSTENFDKLKVFENFDTDFSIMMKQLYQIDTTSKTDLIINAAVDKINERISEVRNLITQYEKSTIKPTAKKEVVTPVVKTEPKVINNSIESKIADIERRRQKELENVKTKGISKLKTIQQYKNVDIKKTVLNFPVGTVFETVLEGRDKGDDFIAWKKDSFKKINDTEIISLDNGVVYSLKDPTSFKKNRDINVKEGDILSADLINAKYDAELTALTLTESKNNILESQEIVFDFNSENRTEKEFPQLKTQFLKLPQLRLSKEDKANVAVKNKDKINKIIDTYFEKLKSSENNNYGFESENDLRNFVRNKIILSTGFNPSTMSDSTIMNILNIDSLEDIKELKKISLEQENNGSKILKIDNNFVSLSEEKIKSAEPMVKKKVTVQPLTSENKNTKVELSEKQMDEFRERILDAPVSKLEVQKILDNNPNMTDKQLYEAILIKADKNEIDSILKEICTKK